MLRCLLDLVCFSILFLFAEKISFVFYHIVILGGGSAGLITALTLKKLIPEILVTVIRSKEIGIIGVGEGSTVGLVLQLHGILGLDPGQFLRIARPTWKLGLRLLWGPRPYFDYTFAPLMDWQWNDLRRENGFYCEEDIAYANISNGLMTHNHAFLRQPNGDPYISRDFSYHVENEHFVAYLEKMVTEEGVVFVTDTVQQVEQDNHGITRLILESGKQATADLYVDASGFRSLLLGNALTESYISFQKVLFCDRAVLGSWQRTDEPIKPYTTAETMNSGWCWQIEHLDHINRGYVYSSHFISDEDAEREFRGKNPKVEKTRLVKFPSGRYVRQWVKNVAAVGNASGFVEPLEATSLSLICDQARLLAQFLLESDMEPNSALR